MSASLRATNAISKLPPLYLGLCAAHPFRQLCAEDSPSDKPRLLGTPPSSGNSPSAHGGTSPAFVDGSWRGWCGQRTISVLSGELARAPAGRGLPMALCLDLGALVPTRGRACLRRDGRKQSHKTRTGETFLSSLGSP